MKNGAGTDKADAWNDLSRDPGVISKMLDGKRVGKDGVHGCAEADEEIGAQSGRAMFQLTLQSD